MSHTYLLMTPDEKYSLKNGVQKKEINFAARGARINSMSMREVARHNIYSASMLVRHANDGRKYLYDVLAIKKKRAARLSETVR